jgi:hypothetical protein
MATTEITVLLDIAKQVPSLIVLVILVKYFLAHMEREGKAFREATMSQIRAVDDLQKAITELRIEIKNENHHNRVGG